MPTTLLGLDFSCAPSARKPLTLAWGQRVGQVVRLDRLDALPALAQWEALITPQASAAPPELAQGFVMACDFPFGLPRPFVDALCAHGPGTLPAQLQGLASPPALPCAATDLARASGAVQAPPPAERLIQALHAHCLDRAGFQALVDGWGKQWHGTRPPGAKLPHRVADCAVPGLSSTSPLQTRYVPVGKMYFEGMRRLVAADLSLPGLRAGRPQAIALEAYPGLLAGEILGKRSYKSESEATHDRLIARMDLVDALEQGRTRLGLRLKLSPAQRDLLVSDPKGDRLDAALCLMQAAWAHAQTATGPRDWGLPAHVDPVEGWILTA